MKRLMPSSLITFLQQNQSCLKADLFAITLLTGTVLYATEGQFDITVPAGTPGWSGPATTFYAGKYGFWTRGPITSEAGFKLNANTMLLSCVPQAGTLFPGLAIGIGDAGLNHLFDGATVWVYTAYMPMGGYGDVSAGIETKFQGTITKAPGLGPKLEFECADPLFLLNMKVPARVMQSNCPWSFADVNCTLAAATYTVNFTAGAGSTSSALVTGLSQADDYFAQGVVTCLTGANAGLSQTVKSYKSGTLTTVVAWLLPIAAGDTFSVIKGCDKTLATCKATVKPDGTTVDNSAHFGGTPFVPPPSISI